MQCNTDAAQHRFSAKQRAALGFAVQHDVFEGCLIIVTSSRSGGCIGSAVQHTVLGVAVHHTCRAGQGRNVAAHSSLAAPFCSTCGNLPCRTWSTSTSMQPDIGDGDCDKWPELDAVCETWCQAKVENAVIEKKIEECKTVVEKMMAQKGVTEISTDRYQVKKSLQSREFISQKCLPNSIWKEYAKVSEFNVLSVKTLGKAKCKAKAEGKVQTLGKKIKAANK